MTDPDRFAPLHHLARDLAHSLARRFDAVIIRAPDPGVAGLADARPLPSLRLVPRSAAAAPLTLVFTPFPGLLVRAGLWHSEAIPACGCDDCAETPESTARRLDWLAECVTGGRFREAITRPPLAGAASRVTIIGGDHGSLERRWTRIARAEASRLMAGGPRRRRWGPWPLRG